MIQVIPKMWKHVRLSEVAELNPRKFSETPDADAPVSFVPMKAVEEESGRMVATEIRPWSAVKKGYTPFQENDILFAKITPCMENGKYALATGLHGGRAAGSTEFHVFRPGLELEPKYLLHYLFSHKVRRAARMSMRGAAGQLRVPTSFFEELKIPLPSLDEQRTIVAEIEKQLTRLDTGVASLKRLQANLKRYRASVLKAACEGKLVPTEAELARKEGRSFESGAELLKRILKERRENWKGRGKYKVPEGPDVANLPALPEGWVWAKSDALFSFVTSGSRGWAEYYSDSGEIFLRIGNLDHENIQLDLQDIQFVTPPSGAEGIRTAVQPNDILISITADVGMVALVPKGLGQAYINQHIALARPLPAANSRYLAYFLCASEGGWGHFKRNQRGATKVGLGLDDIRGVPVPLPPLKEQERIVVEIERRLSVVDQGAELVTINERRAGSLRQAVLQRAFNKT